MSDPINRPDAIIIGGGIGGLACAVGLTRKGVRVRLGEVDRLGRPGRCLS